MNEGIRRLYVEKKEGYDVESVSLLKNIKESLGLLTIKNIRILNRYDISAISDDIYEKAKITIFSEPPVDVIYEEKILMADDEVCFAVEYLPGQYDQRADSASQCIQILTQGERPEVNYAKVVIIKGEITHEDLEKVKQYCINPVDSREALLNKPNTLKTDVQLPNTIEVIKGFIEMTENQMKEFINNLGLAMSLGDLKFCQSYFRDEEKRNPTITEIRVIDTYWSDHCRHTTFMTSINKVTISEGKYSTPIKESYQEYIKSRKFVYENKEKHICLMDIATIAIKEFKKRGMLSDLDESDEINACSIKVKVDVDGIEEDWLVMFKNETHNHPTEIEPFGGAATCLGGSIRDPLSGRTYVYQAMRVTGSGDPRNSIQNTIPGKLPQKKITTLAASGYSSYGNQIGLATGQVCEIYDDGYIAKRMEVGAVIAAAPSKNVVRNNPEAGDVVILIGGRTGRDGCGGATGSSKQHTDESLYTCGSEVQKGNAPTERKIQRLFRNPSVSTMIKRCNDFGAGGVAVAIGELTDGLDINLDVVPKKYEGLDGTELAISESQERIAVVISAENVEKFIQLSMEENLEATVVAKVHSENRLRMYWKEKAIVDLNRDFLNTNGVRQNADVVISSPNEVTDAFYNIDEKSDDSLKELWIKNIQKLNVCSQRGLVEKFDSTIGAGTVLMPFGGTYESSPQEGMAAKIPVLDGDTTTGTLMSFGYNPDIARWSPFHGAVYSVVEAAAKIVAMGGNYNKIWLTLQEYFEKLGDSPQRWGKPFSAMLGAFYAQKQLGIAAIGGKDSMSGSFNDMDVPPTLISFAVSVVNVNNIVSSEFKGFENKIVLLETSINEDMLPNFDCLKSNFNRVTELIQRGVILSASSIKFGGIAETISKMAFGNKIGARFIKDMKTKDLFKRQYGSFILEIDKDADAQDIFKKLKFEHIGYTQREESIHINSLKIGINEVYDRWEEPLEKVFPTKTQTNACEIKNVKYDGKYTKKSPIIKCSKPTVFIPVFPGTNCEYDSAKAFKKAGANVEIMVMRNLTPNDIELSLKDIAKHINKSQIIMLPGGFSAGDEPDGSGKFISAVFRNPLVKESIMNLIKNRDGLMLGICNGFQALIKLGLVPYGEIRDIDEKSPTLTYNEIGRHVSTMVRTKITSKLSPWFDKVSLGDINTVPVSHGEGRFVATEDVINKLIESGQVATQYVDFNGNASIEIPHNPNGSMWAIEGITSPDGRILGKMAHSERIGSNVVKNINGNMDQKIFESGVNYFK